MPIICIGRQFGSGGHELALRTGQLLGIRVYEKDILHMACKYGGLPVETLADADEKATNPYLYRVVCEGNHHVTRGLPTSETLYDLQSHEIRRIAAEGSCIFVGRCADHVLADSGLPLLRVFVTAPFEYRVRRKMELEQLSHSRAVRLVRRMDRQRSQYRQHYTGRPWDDPAAWDQILLCSTTSMDAAARDLVARFQALRQ